MARARTLWDEGTEPGRRVAVLGAAVTLGIAIADLVVNHGLTLLFDLGFVALCVALALMVRPEDFFTVGVLPPPLLLGLCWVLGLFAPGAIADDGAGALAAAITGMADHADALMIGYLLCLGCLAIRRRWVQVSNRSGSPAPRRSTSGVPSE